ncbi:MAG: hypothetical protein ABW195_14795 [Ilumatobacteraceae bacterium]
MTRSPRCRVAPLAASVVAVLALGLAACGDDDDAGTTTLVTDVTSPEVTAATVTAGSDVEVSTPGSGSVDVAGSTPGSGRSAGVVGTEDEYVDALAGAIGFEDPETADCVAAALVDAVGYDQITEAGITVEEFGPDDLTAGGLTFDEGSLGDVSSDVSGCGDIVDQLVTALGMDDSDRACVEDNLDNDQLAELLVADFFEVEPSAEVSAGSDAVEVCIDGSTSTSLAS